MAHAIREGCIGCTACARQCPAEAIYGAPERLHAVDPARCTDCGVCGWICPIPDVVVDARGRSVRHVPRPERPRPVVDPDLCNGCGACVDVCPFGVLGIEGLRHSGRAEIRNPESCVSCGYCRDICLKRALHLRGLPGS